MQLTSQRATLLFDATVFIQYLNSIHDVLHGCAMYVDMLLKIGNGPHQTSMKFKNCHCLIHGITFLSLVLFCKVARAGIFSKSNLFWQSGFYVDWLWWLGSLNWIKSRFWKTDEIGFIGGFVYSNCQWQIYCFLSIHLINQLELKS